MGHPGSELLRRGVDNPFLQRTIDNEGRRALPFGLVQHFQTDERHPR